MGTGRWWTERNDQMEHYGEGQASNQSVSEFTRDPVPSVDSLTIDASPEQASIYQ